MEPDDDYFLPESIIARLQNALEARARSEHREWTVSFYRLEDTPVRGVRMQEIRFVVHNWHRTWEVEAQIIPPETERIIALQLLQQPHLDDKLAAMLFIDEILIPRQRLLPSHLSQFEAIFAAGCINNRKVGDMFAKKVLAPLLDRAPTQVSAILRDRWMVAPQLWQARAALAALTPLASDAVHQETLMAGSEVLLRREETEAKSVAGSALRAVGKWRADIVLEFLNDDENLVLFDAPALNRALHYLENDDATTLRNRRRALQTRRRRTSAQAEPSGSGSGEGELGTATEVEGSGTGAGSADVVAPASTSTGQDEGISIGMPPGVITAQEVGGARDPLGIGAGIAEEMEEGIGLPAFDEDVRRALALESIEHGGVEEREAESTAREEREGRGEREGEEGAEVEGEGEEEGGEEEGVRREQQGRSEEQ